MSASERGGHGKFAVWPSRCIRLLHRREGCQTSRVSKPMRQEPSTSYQAPVFTSTPPIPTSASTSSGSHVAWASQGPGSPCPRALAFPATARVALSRSIVVKTIVFAFILHHVLVPPGRCPDGDRDERNPLGYLSPRRSVQCVARGDEEVPAQRAVTPWPHTSPVGGPRGAEGNGRRAPPGPGVRFGGRAWSGSNPTRGRRIGCGRNRTESADAARPTAAAETDETGPGPVAHRCRRSCTFRTQGWGGGNRSHSLR